MGPDAYPWTRPEAIASKRARERAETRLVSREEGAGPEGITQRRRALTDLDPDDADAPRAAWLAAPTHRGRVVRTLLALVLTAAGLLVPVPYVGYAYGVALFAPAAVLLGFALGDARHRKLLYWLGFPTAFGLALSVLSFVTAASRYTSLIAPIVGWTLVTTLVALLLGAPRVSS